VELGAAGEVDSGGLTEAGVRVAVEDGADGVTAVVVTDSEVGVTDGLLAVAKLLTFGPVKLDNGTAVLGVTGVNVAVAVVKATGEVEGVTCEAGPGPVAGTEAKTGTVEETDGAGPETAGEAGTDATEVAGTETVTVVAAGHSVG